MDTNKMREQVESQFEAFFAEYEKKREANGWMPLEAHVLVHMRNAWIASREAVVVELPETLSSAALDEVEVAEVLLAGQGLSNIAGAIGCAYLICKELPAIRSAIETQGLKVSP